MKIPSKVVVILALLFSLRGVSREYFVATDGSDRNAGTIDKPLASIEKARDLIRGLGPDKAGEPITVFLREGLYHLPRAVEFLRPIPARPMRRSSTRLIGTNRLSSAVGSI